MSTGATLPFRLPSDVTVTRQTLSEGVAYVFHHRRLGLLGRLVTTAYPGRQTLLDAECRSPRLWPASGFDFRRT